MKKPTYHAISFTGRRDNNQDACTVIELGNSTYFFAVADGMGGVAGGQVASNHILDNAKSILQKINFDDISPEKLKETLSAVFGTSQQALRNKVKERPDLSGMGTTLSAVLVQDDKIVWGNIGDSRVYLLRQGDLLQLTTDHTYIEDYRKTKGDDIPQSIIDQYSHYLTRAIDGGADDAELFPDKADYDTLKPGDIILVCSDGLITNKVNTNTDLMQNLILGTSTLKQAAKQLISYAFHSDSKDNISVVLAEFGTCERKNIKINKHFYPPVAYIMNKIFDYKYYLIVGAILILAIILLLLI
ncbi:MAG: protein phosphatase 2C domain-containing protein [Bacteroidetes bacterium]|nr:protein phosphatase 2C domain-containing protein [Bacteroidota bacterium]